MNAANISGRGANQHIKLTGFVVVNLKLDNLLFHYRTGVGDSH